MRWTVISMLLLLGVALLHYALWKRCNDKGGYYAGNACFARESVL
jgi:hypothetical protein